MLRTAVRRKSWKRRSGTPDSFAGFAPRPTQVFDGLAVAVEDMPAFRPVLIMVLPGGHKQVAHVAVKSRHEARLSVLCRLKADEPSLKVYLRPFDRLQLSEAYSGFVAGDI